MPSVTLPSLITAPADAISDALAVAGDMSRCCLRDWLRTVPGPRKRAGRWHRLEFVLALAVCAFTATGHLPNVLAAIRNLAIGAFRKKGHANMAAGRRYYERDDRRIHELYGYA